MDHRHDLTLRDTMEHSVLADPMKLDHLDKTETQNLKPESL